MTPRPIPYPSDTLAKGWRFELDLERVMQSDTWALAAPDVKPWLLMLWATAWQQKPCGSMPSEDALIAARLGMTPKLFTKSKTILLRGWWLAEDGRLYQDTIVERVLEMLAYKEKEKRRKADYRARMSGGSPDLSHGTDKRQPRDSTGSDATGTGTGTGTSIGIHTDVAKDESSVCVKGAHTQISDEFKNHIRTTRPELNADLVFANFVSHYPLGKRTFAKWQQWVSSERVGVAEAVQAAKHDPDTRPNVELRGIAAGIGKWDDSREQWHQYKARVQAAEQQGVAA